MTSVQDEDLKKELDKLQVKVTLNNIYDRSHLHKLSITPSINEKATNGLKNSANEGIIIGRKENRIAKVQPKQKSETIDLIRVLDSPKLYETVYEAHNTPKEYFSKNKINMNNKTDTYKLADDIYLSKLNDNYKKTLLDHGIPLTSIAPDLHRESIKPVPDYFNDLLTWNHDILNYDKLPQWNHLIHSDLVTEYTTHDIQGIGRELHDLEDAISSYYATDSNNDTGKVTKFYDTLKDNTINTNKNTAIRRVADNIGPSKELIIKGEAKYFRYDKEPIRLAEKYIKTVDIVNRITNIDPNDDFQKKIPRKDGFNVIGNVAFVYFIAL